MNQLFPAYLSLIIFIVVIFIHKNLSDVSPVTDMNEYRKMFSVKQGSSADSQIGISSVPAVIGISNSKKFANHVRNLRVFLAPSETDQGEVLIYLEQAKPHQFFAIYGPFMPASSTVKFTWIGTTTFSFYATGTDNHFKHYSIDVSKPSLRVETNMLKTKINKTNFQSEQSDI